MFSHDNLNCVFLEGRTAVVTYISKKKLFDMRRGDMLIPGNIALCCFELLSHPIESKFC